RADHLLIEVPGPADLRPRARTGLLHVGVGVAVGIAAAAAVGRATTGHAVAGATRHLAAATGAAFVVGLALEFGRTQTRRVRRDDQTGSRCEDHAHLDRHQKPPSSVSTPPPLAGATPTRVVSAREPRIITCSTPPTTSAAPTPPATTAI